MSHRWLLGTFFRAALLMLGASGLPPSPALAAGPCDLLTPAEIAPVTGGPVSALKPSGPGMCAATAPGFDILLRLAERKGTGTEMEDAGMAAMKKMGVQMEVRTFDAMTCSTLVPPAHLQSMGFNTTCSIRKSAWVAAVEITAKTRQAQVPIETLRALAGRMASRF